MHDATRRSGPHLSEPDVIAIRAQYAPDVAGLAHSYGVSRATINSVLAGRTWRYLLPGT